MYRYEGPEMQSERSITLDLASARDATKDLVTSSMEEVCSIKDEANDLFFIIGVERGLVWVEKV